MECKDYQKYSVLCAECNFPSDIKCCKVAKDCNTEKESYKELNKPWRGKFDV